MKLQLRGNERKSVIQRIRGHFRAPVDGKKVQKYVETAVQRPITLGVAQALVREAWREKDRTMREDEKESAKALRERRVPAYAGQLELFPSGHHIQEICFVVNCLSKVGNTHTGLRCVRVKAKGSFRIYPCLC